MGQDSSTLAMEGGDGSAMDINTQLVANPMAVDSMDGVSTSDTVTTNLNTESKNVDNDQTKASFGVTSNANDAPTASTPIVNSNQSPSSSSIAPKNPETSTTSAMKGVNTPPTDVLAKDNTHTAFSIENVNVSAMDINTLRSNLITESGVDPTALDHIRKDIVLSHVNLEPRIVNTAAASLKNIVAGCVNLEPSIVNTAAASLKNIESSKDIPVEGIKSTASPAIVPRFILRVNRENVNPSPETTPAVTSTNTQNPNLDNLLFNILPSDLPVNKLAELNQELAEVDTAYNMKIAMVGTLPVSERSAQVVSANKWLTKQKTEVRKRYGVTLRLRNEDKKGRQNFGLAMHGPWMKPKVDDDEEEVDAEDSPESMNGNAQPAHVLSRAIGTKSLAKTGFIETPSALPGKDIENGEPAADSAGGNKATSTEVSEHENAGQRAGQTYGKEKNIKKRKIYVPDGGVEPGVDENGFAHKFAKTSATGSPPLQPPFIGPLDPQLDKTKLRDLAREGSILADKLPGSSIPDQHEDTAANAHRQAETKVQDDAMDLDPPNPVSKAMNTQEMMRAMQLAQTEKQQQAQSRQRNAAAAAAAAQALGLLGESRSIYGEPDHHSRALEAMGKSIALDNTSIQKTVPHRPEFQGVIMQVQGSESMRMTAKQEEFVAEMKAERARDNQRRREAKLVQRDDLTQNSAATGLGPVSGAAPAQKRRTYRRRSQVAGSAHADASPSSNTPQTNLSLPQNPPRIPTWQGKPLFSLSQMPGSADAYVSPYSNTPHTNLSLPQNTTTNSPWQQTFGSSSKVAASLPPDFQERDRARASKSLPPSAPPTIQAGRNTKRNPRSDISTPSPIAGFTQASANVTHGGRDNHLIPDSDFLPSAREGTGFMPPSSAENGHDRGELRAGDLPVPDSGFGGLTGAGVPTTGNGYSAQGRPISSTPGDVDRQVAGAAPPADYSNEHTLDFLHAARTASPFGQNQFDGPSSDLPRPGVLPENQGHGLPLPLAPSGPEVIDNQTPTIDLKDLARKEEYIHNHLIETLFTFKSCSQTTDSIAFWVSRILSSYKDAGREERGIGLRRLHHLLVSLENLIRTPNAYDELRNVDFDIVLLWIFFHGVVYNTTAPVGWNEFMCIKEFNTYADKCDLLRELHPRRDAVVRCLKAGPDHIFVLGKWQDGSVLQQSDDAAMRLCLDLRFLVHAGETEEYAQFSGDLRKRFGWMTEAEYALSRIRGLEGFLERKTLFFTKYCEKTFGAKARANMVVELAERKKFRSEWEAAKEMLEPVERPVEVTNVGMAAAVKRMQSTDPKVVEARDEASRKLVGASKILHQGDQVLGFAGPSKKKGAMMRVAVRSVGHKRADKKVPVGMAARSIALKRKRDADDEGDNDHAVETPRVSEQ